MPGLGEPGTAACRAEAERARDRWYDPRRPWAHRPGSPIVGSQVKVGTTGCAASSTSTMSTSGRLQGEDESRDMSDVEESTAQSPGSSGAGATGGGERSRPAVGTIGTRVSLSPCVTKTRTSRASRPTETGRVRELAAQLEQERSKSALSTRRAWEADIKADTALEQARRAAEEAQGLRAQLEQRVQTGLHASTSQAQEGLHRLAGQTQAEINRLTQMREAQQQTIEEQEGKIAMLQ